MSDTTNYTDEQEIVDQKAIELAEDFSYDGYQVVRRELFAHLREPAVVIRRDSVTFNTSCIPPSYYHFHGLFPKSVRSYFFHPFILLYFWCHFCTSNVSAK